jgi:hypothetical protein
MLPTGAGKLVYADYSADYTNAANSLWIPLIEKAYAQWNETGKAGRDGLNAYASIQGGWMATVDAQVLGHNATDYIMTRTAEQTAISALAAGKAVTIGTLSWSGTNCGLYGNHAYAIIGYNAGSDTFILYNPWGSNQPGPLTWSQLQATTSQLCVADAFGSVPMSGVASKTGFVNAARSVSESGTEAFLRSDLASPAAPGRQFPAMTSATRELFAIWGSSGATHSRQTRAADLMAGIPSASQVDAVFAADGLPLLAG